MKKMKAAASPDAYVAELNGWQRECIEPLRRAVRSAGTLDEVIKWGHLVYLAGGPVLYIRAEESRVLFGFWRGKRLREIEPRLKASGKYELATIEMHDGDRLKPAVVRQLVKAAIELNAKLGNPTDAAKKH